MPGRAANVRYWGSIGLNADIGIRARFWPEAVLGPMPSRASCPFRTWS